MSDTTGWKLAAKGVYHKTINGTLYEIKKQGDRNWWCYVLQKWIGFGPRLADAKLAAHRHAEESE